MAKNFLFSMSGFEDDNEYFIFNVFFAKYGDQVEFQMNKF